MWQIVESISFIPQDASTVHCLEFVDGCMYLVYVDVEFSGDSEDECSAQFLDTGNQCSAFDTQLELNITLEPELNYSSRWV
jgi:hypothetical protein